MSVRNKTTKFLFALIIFSVFAPAVLFSVPKKVDAQWATFDIPTEIETGFTAGTTAVGAVQQTIETGFSFKQFALDIAEGILRAYASKLLQQMTKSTVNWINSGFHGAPLFLENPGSFFKDIAKYEVKNLIDLFGYDRLKYPFGQAFALNAINAYRGQLAINAQYSLSKVINDPLLLERYRNDFYVGGWNGFLINTQYPQNNYMGFQMLATEELARRIQGTSQNAAEKVQSTLQQGMGFLSPQTCPDNGGENEYNSVLANQFQRPSFDYAAFEKTHPYNPDSSAAEDQQYYDDLGKAKAAWDEKNTCKGGLVNTTPGSVVASQIYKALGASQDQTGLAAQLKGSVSLILDSLLNHFLDKGLNALASKVNPKPVQDDWSYNGQTLGGPTGANAAWDASPDEVVIVDNFKKLLLGKTVRTGPNGETIESIGNTGNGTYISGDIANTQKELLLIDNEDPNNPGIIQMLSLIWPQARELDICIPGPDFRWQERLNAEFDKVTKAIATNSTSGDEEDNTAVQSDLVLRELKFAVNFFKDFMDIKMTNALPDSILYISAVDEIKDLSQQSDELTDARRVKNQVLARLKSISASLSSPSFSTQPALGSPQEKILVTLKKQYNAMRGSISTTGTIEDKRNELSIAKDKYLNLKNLLPQCTAERTEKGWSNPGGMNSTLNGGSGQGSGVPESEPPGLAAVCADVAAARNAIPGAVITHDQMGAVLSTAATKNTASGWGLLSKPGGNRCDTSRGPVSCDRIFNGPSCLIYDVLSDSGTEAIPSGQAKPQCLFNGSFTQSSFVDIGGGNGNISSATCIKVTMPDGSIVQNGAVISPSPTAPTPTAGATCNVSGGTGGGSILGTIDLNQVQFVNSPNVSSWAQTTTITGVRFGPNVTLDFSKKQGSGRWPDQQFVDSAPGQGSIYYTVWLFVKINGQWVGSGFNRVYFGQNNGEGGSPLCGTTDWYYDSRWGSMFGHQIQPGEQIAFMVTAGDARNNGAGGTNIQERSNAVIVAAPAGSVTISGGTGSSGSGTEKELFCGVPIVSGYPHEMFQSPLVSNFSPAPSNPEYKNLPLVNAADVMSWDKWLWGTGDARANVDISCDAIFRANALDYKGNIPGPTTTTEIKPDSTDNPGAKRDLVIPPIPPEGAACTTPPADGDTRHGNHQAEVAAAKASIEAEGVVFSPSTPECSTDNNNRFEITKRAARLIGGSGSEAAGLLDKPGGNNCLGYAVDIIAFPDGYIYDVLNGTAPDGNGPGWSSGTCLPADPSRYRSAI